MKRQKLPLKRKWWWSNEETKDDKTLLKKITRVLLKRETQKEYKCYCTCEECGDVCNPWWKDISNEE